MNISVHVPAEQEMQNGIRRKSINRITRNIRRA